MTGNETQSPALDAWTCDICGDQIKDPGTGLVIFRNSDERPMYDFKIVHKSMDGWRCWSRAEADGYRSSYELSWCLGIDGLTALLSWLSHGPVDGGGHPDIATEDLDGYVDLVRRLQIPHYELARRKFRDQDVHERLAGVNPVYPYTQESLRWIAAQPPSD